MRATLLHLLLLSISLGGAGVFAAEPAVPETFLPATGYLRQALDQSVTGTFNKTPADEVIEYLSVKGNVRVHIIINPGTASFSQFTGTFKDTPFRAALYKLSQEAGIKATLRDRGDGGSVLVIVPKEHQ